MTEPTGKGTGTGRGPPRPLPMGTVTPTEMEVPVGLVSGGTGMVVPGGKVLPIDRVRPAGGAPCPTGERPAPSGKPGSTPPPSPRPPPEPPSGNRPPPNPVRVPPRGRLGKMLLPDPREDRKPLRGKVEKGLLSGKLGKGLPTGKDEKARLDESRGAPASWTSGAAGRRRAPAGADRGRAEPPQGPARRWRAPPPERSRATGRMEDPCPRGSTEGWLPGEVPDPPPGRRPGERKRRPSPGCRRRSAQRSPERNGTSPRHPAGWLPRPGRCSRRRPRPRRRPR